MNGDFESGLVGWEVVVAGGGEVAVVDDIQHAGNHVGQVRGSPHGPIAPDPPGFPASALLGQVGIGAQAGALRCAVRFRVAIDATESGSDSGGSGDIGFLSFSVRDAETGEPLRGAGVETNTVQATFGIPGFQIHSDGLPALILLFESPSGSVGALSVEGVPSNPNDPLGSVFMTASLDLRDLALGGRALAATIHMFVGDRDDGLDLVAEIDDCAVGGEAPSPPAPRQAIDDATAVIVQAASTMSELLSPARAAQINHKLVGSGGATTKLAQAASFLDQGKACPAADKEEAAVEKLRAAEAQLAGFPVCPDGAGCVAPLDRVRGLALLHRARAEADSAFHRLCDDAPQCGACGPDPCTVPGTTMVVPSGQPTIAGALAHIGATGTVVLEPGVFVENVVIAAGRHVVLRAAGEAGSARVVAADAGKPTVAVDAGASACVAGIGLEGGASGLAAGTLGHPAGTIALRDSKATGNAGDGLMVFAADLRVLDSAVAGNGGAGGVVAATNLRVARSLFVDNRGGGWAGPSDACDLLVSASAVYEWTLFSFSEGAGLSIVAAEDVSVGHNIFVLNDGSGLAIDCSSDISIFNNGSVENGLHGIEIADSSAIGLHTNFVDRSAASGVRLDSLSGVYIEDNTITRNGASGLDAGILATDVSYFLLLENPSISNNAGRGVRQTGGEVALLLDNVADANAVGFDITDVADLTVDSNSAGFNDTDGIVVLDSPNADVQENSASDSGDVGIHIAGCDGATVMENTSAFNGGSGLVVERSDDASIDSNLVTFNLNHGVHLVFSSDSVVANSTISFSGGLLGLPCAQSDVESIADYRDAGILVESSSSVEVVGNSVSDNECGGVLVVGSSYAIVSDNRPSAGGGITGNGGWGVLVVDSTSVMVSDNLIAETATVETELGAGRWGDGVAALDTDAEPPTAVEVSCNTIENNARVGISFFGAGGSVCGNIVTGNVIAMALEGGADPEICAMCDPDDCDDACDDGCLCFTGNDRDDVAVGFGIEPPPPVKAIEDGP